MDIHKKQRGQSIVEFALVLPLFVFMLMGFGYSALLCHDYIALTEVARSSARALAVDSSATNQTNIRTYYTTNKPFLTNLYPWEQADFQFTVDSTNNFVTAKVTAPLNTGIGTFELGGASFTLPPMIGSECTMRKEG